ncbi:alpha/beta hydrolase [Bifidobacterium avesanii]|nr:alpha/beta hydrolase [Bifidobacterium avesanii]KAB8290992.1 alpha/beta hydrolase [Bifidobacterium avesanii]
MGYIVHNQRQYVDGDGLDSRLLYVVTPAETVAGPAPRGGWPLVVYIHGGGWEQGNFRRGEEMDVMARPIFPAMLSAGYALAFVNYRLTGEAQWPAQILDCKAAIRYLRAHAGEWDVNPDRIAVYGSSSGGHLCQFLGVTDGDARYEDPSMGCAGASSRVSAVISSYGISDLTAWRKMNDHDFMVGFLGAGYTREQAWDASPIAHVDGSAAPMLLAHAQNDGLVNWDMTPVMERAVRCAIGDGKVVSWYPAYGGHGSDEVFQSPLAITLYIGFLARFV